jgi:aryl-alcohol dehydrogenase-like predicted oxidoreductase
MTYGTPSWRPWVLDEAASRPFFRRAVEAGINFFDTADMYSNGVSEEVTGRALREFAARRDEFVIATKVFYPIGDGPNMGGLSRKHVQQSCDASLKRLGVDTIDLYVIHRFDPAVPIDETLETLNDLVRVGKVRYIGASSGSAWRMAQALATSDRRGWARFISMQNHYNLLYREEEREMIPLCQHEGLGLTPWSPMARGLLTRPTPTGRTVTTNSSARSRIDSYANAIYDNAIDWAIVDEVQAIASERAVPMGRVALAWLLGQPGVAAPIVGATRLGHLDDAIEAVDLELSPEERARLEAPYTPHSVRGHDD